MTSAGKRGFHLKGFLGGGLVLAGLGLFLLVPALRNLWLAAGQDAWVPVEATVTVSKSYSVRKQERQEKGYAFAYRYRFQDQEFTGKRYSFAQIGKGASQGVKRFSPGKTITVYVDPEHPRRVVVERRRPGLFVYLGIPLGLLAVFGAGLMSFHQGPKLLFAWMDRRVASRNAWGARFAELDREPDEALVDEAIAAMPRRTRKNLRNYAKAGKTDFVARNLVEHCGVDVRLAEAIVRRFEQE